MPQRAQYFPKATQLPWEQGHRAVEGSPTRVTVPTGQDTPTHQIPLTSTGSHPSHLSAHPMEAGGAPRPPPHGGQAEPQDDTLPAQRMPAALSLCPCPSGLHGPAAGQPHSKASLPRHPTSSSHTGPESEGGPCQGVHSPAAPSWRCRHTSRPPGPRSRHTRCPRSQHARAPRGRAAGLTPRIDAQLAPPLQEGFQWGRTRMWERLGSRLRGERGTWAAAHRGATEASFGILRRRP